MSRWASWCVGVALTACSAPQPSEPAPITSAQLPVPVPPSSLQSASAAPSASASASAAGGLPVRASTPGVIQCESVDCDLATQVCCAGYGPGSQLIGRCLPKVADERPLASVCCQGGQGFCGNDVPAFVHSCDEASDCGAGKRCCSMMGGEGDVSRRYCSAECAAETCLAGSTCANGNPCRSAEGALSGECSLQLKPPKCGATTCKKGESCCWNPEAQSGRCADKCEADVERTFECTSTDQCERQLCEQKESFAGPFRCGGDWFTFGVLCRTIKDCPERISASGSYYGPRVTKCAADELLPKGVKACVYE